MNGRLHKMPCKRMFAFAVVLAAASAMASAEAKRTSPTVQFFRPEHIKPLVREDSEFLKNGMAVHRRVLSKAKDGSVHIDVGYNNYKAGVSSDVPYAYTKDELCYIPSGEMYALSDGKAKIFAEGDFMWRPAGASTTRTRVLKDAVTICAFAPARDDDWSHRLPPSEVGKWRGDPSRKPKMIFRNFKEVPPITVPGRPEFSDGRVVSRRIFTRREHGVTYVDASHNSYKAGVEAGAFHYAHDQLCWMESGEIEVRSHGADHIIRAGDFVWQPIGARIEHMKVRLDSVVICFSAPART